MGLVHDFSWKLLPPDQFHGINNHEIIIDI